MKTLIANKLEVLSETIPFRNGQVGIRVKTCEDAIQTLTWLRTDKDWAWIRNPSKKSDTMLLKKLNRGHGSALRVQHVLNHNKRLWELQSDVYRNMIDQMQRCTKYNFNNLFADCLKYSFWSSGLVMGDYEYIVYDNMVDYNLICGDDKFKCVMVLKNGELFAS